MHTATDTFNVLKGKSVFTIRAIDNIEMEVLRNGEDTGWRISYIEGEGYECYDPDAGEMLDDMYFETIEEIELALETWEIKVAHYQRAA